MAWSSPLTAVSSAALTAGQWNASVRDNLLETVPAKATAAGRIFVSTGANTIAERVPTTAAVNTSESTTSATMTDLTTPGPALTVTTGTRAIVFLTARIRNDTATQAGIVGYTMSGATTIAATESRSLRHETNGTTDFNRSSYATIDTALTAGSNTFTAKYLATGGTAEFAQREIAVVPL